MQIDDSVSAHARQQIDPRDRATQQHRADKPEKADRRAVALGGAVSQHVDEDEKTQRADPAAVCDRTRTSSNHLVDIRA